MPFLLIPDAVLSAAELSAARLDGDVVEVDDAYMPADAAETVQLRAASLRPLLHRSLAATHMAAAWVHGAAARAPVRLPVQRAVARRLTHVIHRRLEYRDPVLPHDDLVIVAGVHVTTPVRTLADLLRAGGDAHVGAARRLIGIGAVTPQQGLAWLEAAGALPNKRPAARLLRDWVRSDQPDVTR